MKGNLQVAFQFILSGYLFIQHVFLAQEASRHKTLFLVSLIRCASLSMHTLCVILHFFSAALILPLLRNFFHLT